MHACMQSDRNFCAVYNLIYINAVRMHTLCCSRLTEQPKCYWDNDVEHVHLRQSFVLQVLLELWSQLSVLQGSLIHVHVDVCIIERTTVHGEALIKDTLHQGHDTKTKKNVKDKFSRPKL